MRTGHSIDVGKIELRGPIVFGPFRLDPAARELRRGEVEVPLPPKCMACLLYLIAHRDRAIGRDELLNAVWGHAHLTDGALAQTILQLRRALGDGGDGVYVKSVRGFGYRWVAGCEPAPMPDSAQAAPPRDPSLENRAGTSGRTAADPPATQVPVTDAAPRMPSTATDHVWRRWRWVALLALGAAGIFAALTLRDPTPATPTPTTGEVMERAAQNDAARVLALVLPVETESSPEAAWIRLGVMDLIATQLRGAGVAAVPASVVLRIAEPRAGETGTDRLRRVFDLTGSDWVLQVSAHRVDERWLVAVRRHTREGDETALRAEASDVMEAARDVVVRLLARQERPALGLTPPEAAVAQVLHRARAAQLEGRLDEALAGIDAAPEVARRDVQLRLLAAQIHLQRGQHDSAMRALSELEGEPAAREVPGIHLTVRANLAVTMAASGQVERARREMFELLDQADRDAAPETLAGLHRSLAIMALNRGDRPGARRHLFDAQRFLTGRGDIHTQAMLDLSIGALDFQEDRIASSIDRFRRARTAFDALDDVDGYVGASSALLHALVRALDFDAAEGIAQDPRTDARALSAPGGASWQLARAELKWARGETADALRIVSGLTAADGDTPLAQRLRVAAASKLAAWRVEDAADPGRAIDVATSLVLSGPVLRDGQLRSEVAVARLAQIRALLSEHRAQEAGEVLQAWSQWATAEDGPSVAVRLALAQAEFAAHRGKTALASEHYGAALALAEASGAPDLVLKVASSYAPWLLGDGDDPVRAGLISERLSSVHDRSYAAALVRLAVLQRRGPRTAWRVALDVAESLAGERTVPAALYTPPAE